MKWVNKQGMAYHQTSIRIRESVYLLAKKKRIPIAEAAEQGLIAALCEEGVEVEESAR